MCGPEPKRVYSPSCIAVYNVGGNVEYLCDLPENHEGEHEDLVERFAWDD